METEEKKDNIEVMKRRLIRIGYFSIIALGIFLFGKILLPVLIPFILAYLMALALNRPVTYLKRKLNCPRPLSSALLLILIIASLSGILGLIGTLVVSWIESAFSFLPDLFIHSILPWLDRSANEFEVWFTGIDPDIAATIDNAVNNTLKVLASGVQTISAGVLAWAGSAVTRIPMFLMNLLITIIATIFISSDLNMVKRFLRRLVPENGMRTVEIARSFFGHTVPKYFLSYVMLLGITFAELTLGLTILRVEKASTIAFFIAILDIFPVLGTGTILLPWAVISALSANYSLAIGLLVMYVVITVIRQVIEPRLVASQISLHPLVTFVGMVCGVKLFGFWGLIAVPLSISFIRKLCEEGVLHIRCFMPYTEAEED